MTIDEIKQKLDELAVLRTAPESLNREKQAYIKSVIPADILAQLEKIEAEYAQKENEANRLADVVEAEIKQVVIQGGASVKGSSLFAVLNKGRVTWDNGGLSGYMVAHPEISAFRKQGEPTCTIRTV